MKPQLRLSQKQKLGLSQSMRTSLRILRMTADEIADDIAQQAAENPFIELHESRGRTLTYDAALDHATSEISLIRSIAQQITTQRLRSEVERAALILVGELRSDGYLDVTLDELASELDMPLGLLADGLKALQSCDPAGIGARTLAECLEIQLVDAGIRPIWATLASQHLDDFRDLRWAKLARLTNWTRDDLMRIDSLLRTLPPVPVVAEALPQQTRVPDLLVERGPDGGLALRLNPDALPRVSVMRMDRKLAVSDDVAQLYRRANDLHLALRSRAVTLKRIGALIITVQADFIRGDGQSIVPFTRNHAAVQLGMHPSTLGRAIRGKAILIAGKTHALSQFFQSSLPTSNGAISPFDVQRRLKLLIQAEDPAAPLADDTICAQLRHEGVDIARRTVAKYRKCMRIPSSFERRRQKGRRDAKASRSAAEDISGH